MLWAAVHLPALPLEALGVAADDPEPIIVVEGELPRAKIVALTAGARAAGIAVGTTAGAACTRSANLAVHRRDPAREAATLDRLAAIGQHFTSIVSPEAPDGLLLEVGGSLRLFGGLPALRERLRTAFESAGHVVRLAFAPTPWAALWLAREHRDFACGDRLPDALGTLPTAALRLPARAAQDLNRLGVQTLREVFRLPRDGLARRFGPALLRDWDRALGDRPEPRRHWQPERRFTGRCELPTPMREIGPMEPFIERLLSQLIGALRRHDAGVGKLALSFVHEPPAPPTVITLRLAAASRDPARLRRLLHTRLEYTRLGTTAIAVALESGVFKPLLANTAALFDAPIPPASGVTALVEMLRGRLGRNAVYGLAPDADGRPERAWRRVEPGAAVATTVPPSP
ncbi:MAG: Y-family DNA polymerase, partial [Gammaproteobacteria bacterium]